MRNVVVIAEARADAEMAKQLAERVFVEEVDWIFPELLKNLVKWRGLQPETGFTKLTDVSKVVATERMPRFPFGGRKGSPLKADGLLASLALLFIRLYRSDEVNAVVFIRDLDNQPERKEGLTQARDLHNQNGESVTVVIGTANTKREAWVLNGFQPLDKNESKVLKKLTQELKFNPCLEAYRLRSTSFEEPDRRRNVKVVLSQLTDDSDERESLCWTETSLDTLRERGHETGLTAYLAEVEEVLLPLITTD